MRPYGFTGYSEPGFQRHHLIPVNLIRHRAFERLFLSVCSAGFDARNFVTNGVLLPATEVMVERTGLPLHRGPHPQYDRLVAECLNELTIGMTRNTAICPISVYRWLSELQGLLRRALYHDASYMLNRNDVRAAAAPLERLDYDIWQLSVHDLLA